MIFGFPPLVVILGPTASGKSALGMELAQQFGGELICADSRTVYEGMDIGTAKPTMQDRTKVLHFGLDLIGPNQAYSAAQFKSMAEESIQDIAGRGKVPIVVGGTGLYIDALLFDFDFLPVAQPAERARLNMLSVDQLQTEILEKDLPIPTNENNPRHLMRVIETGGATPSSSKQIRRNTLVIGLQPDMDVLKQRIKERIDTMIVDGLLVEVEHLHKIFGWDAPGMLSTGYKAFRGYVDGNQSLDEAKEMFARNDYQLARRQRTWFKRNKSIHWVDDPRDAVAIVTTFLNKKQ
jgi:tRNA dimethylallyltransferase